MFYDNQDKESAYRCATFITIQKQDCCIGWATEHRKVVRLSNIITINTIHSRWTVRYWSPNKRKFIYFVTLGKREAQLLMLETSTVNKIRVIGNSLQITNTLRESGRNQWFILMFKTFNKTKSQVYQWFQHI